MARARRRPTKTAAQKPDEAAENEPTKQEGDAEDHPTQAEQDDLCPACKKDDTTLWAAADKENWVRCDACKTWFHWRCAGDGGDLDAVDKWFCKACMAADPTRTITMKPPARKSARKKPQRDYAGLHTGQDADPNRWLRMLEGKAIQGDPFRRMEGGEVGVEWLESDDGAMREPFVIEDPEGLGMKMPPRSTTVDDIADTVGRDTPVEVIDVATQSNIPGWTLGKWADYFKQEPHMRDKTRNVISLEVSGTKLADKILPPRLVREIDWVEKFWPPTKKGKGQSYPKVQLYCLMGVAGAWTDWHVDFAGSSVYYHILHGSKVFYFIRPTPANLAAYEKWSGTELQNHSWLGDMVDEVFKVELTAGNTMFIPTGWIHAVYTPVDTVVFGGNFLHSYNIATQLKVREIEIATHVPKKFRFPLFARLCWYAGENYLRALKAKEEFSPRVLEGIEALGDFLVSEARTMERGTDSAKREAKEQVPSDRVKDAPALARELRWRVRLAAGYPSDDEGRSSRKTKATGHEPAGVTNGVGHKRKRLDADVAEHAEGEPGPFRNFKRRAWESVSEKPTERESRAAKAQRPDVQAEGWREAWMDWRDDAVGVEGGEDVVVDRRRDVVIKVRRTAKGLERQRVERVLEDWVWSGESPAPSSSPCS
ncbi:Clavaminate synthase-like protein, partial [Obba rivulosa]